MGILGKKKYTIPPSFAHPLNKISYLKHSPMQLAPPGTWNIVPGKGDTPEETKLQANGHFVTCMPTKPEEANCH